MMRAFRPVEGGWSSSVDLRERSVLAQAATEAAEVIGGGRLEEGAPSSTTTASGDGPEPADEAALLAALDFEPDVRTVSDTPDPALDLLLPAAAPLDPALSAQVRATYGAVLRTLKVERLRALAEELLTPSGPDGTVLVRAGQEGEWLSAVNDLRLFHAARLGLEGAEDLERVRRDAAQLLGPDRGGRRAPEPEELRRAMALGVYELLTWWQESLLTSVLSAE